CKRWTTSSASALTLTWNWRMRTWILLQMAMPRTLGIKAATRMALQVSLEIPARKSKIQAATVPLQILAKKHRYPEMNHGASQSRPTPPVDPVQQVPTSFREKSEWTRNYRKCWHALVSDHAVNLKNGSVPAGSRSMAR